MFSGFSTALRAVRNAGSLDEAVQTERETSACGSGCLSGPSAISSLCHTLGARQEPRSQTWVGAAGVPARATRRSPMIWVWPLTPSLTSVTTRLSLPGSRTLQGKTQTVSNAGDDEFSTVGVRISYWPATRCMKQSRMPLFRGFTPADGRAVLTRTNR